MPIPAKRFQFLDQETNLPVLDFASQKSTSIFNAPGFNIEDITQQLNGLIGNNDSTGVQDLLKQVGDAKSLPGLRSTRDFFSSTVDQDAVPGALESTGKELFGEDRPSINSFRGLNSGCSGGIIGQGGQMGGYRRYGINGVYRNQRSSRCDLAGFMSMVNKVTGGQFGTSLVNRTGLTKMIQGVALHGSELGIPGVMTALTNGIQDQSLLAKVGSTVMAGTAFRGDALSMMDLVSHPSTASMTAMVPSLAQLAVTQFKLPTEITAVGQSLFAQQWGNTMTNSVGSQWNHTGQRLNSGWIGRNEAVTGLMRSQSNRAPITFSADVQGTTDEAYLFTGARTNRRDPAEQLSKDFSGWL